MKMIKRNQQANGLDALVGDFFNEKFLNWPVKAHEQKWWRVPANISENQDEWRVDLAVPGMKKEDIKIELDEDMLKVFSEPKDTKQADAEKYSWKEFAYTSFSRSFKLPEDRIKADAVKASYENGVLSISLPKKEEAKPQPPKMIEVS